MCVQCYDAGVEAQEIPVEKQLSAYYLAHREAILKYQRAYRQANPEKKAALRRKYYLAHREQEAVYQREYRQRKKESVQ
jgi:hypothetical protein